MPIILGILVKDWKYFAVIAALMFAVGWIYHRGELRVEAADAKAAAAAVVRDQKEANDIKSKVDAAVADYDALAPVPVPVRVPVLVCHASDSGPVSASPGAATGSNSAGAGLPVGAGSTDARSGSFDPAPAISDTGTKADAEIIHLQKKVKLLQDLVRAYQDAGLVAK